jgi:exopolyphosphatase / guanosine-5'-triphosphate,3'-diphosphate pyrophosphatase
VTRVAAIDCGTNSIRLLVADVDSTLHEIDRRLEIVRLGEGVDRTGRLAPAALARTLGALERYARRIEELGVTRVRMVATSATRDAANRDKFVAGVTRLLGVPPEVISGDEEARLSYLGATYDLPGDVAGPILVTDIGGGSTELVLGGGPPDAGDGGPSRATTRPATAAVSAACSVDIGCVRLTERHFATDPPTSAAVAAARADIEAALDLAAASVPLHAAASLVGLAGSVTTVGAIHLGLADYDPEAIHRSRVPASAVREISDRLLVADHAERAAIPVMHPGRVDVIAAGALVLRHIVDRTGVDEVVVSEHDILDGIAWSLVR